jgi:hypothetical protein
VEQIIYISTSRNEYPDSSMVREILETSRRNNARDDLSGLLLVGGRRFLQVLEGPSDAIGNAYARIRQDRRHFALVELSRRHVEERSFPNWSMGYEEEPQALLPQVEPLTAGVSNPMIKAQLISFAEMHSKAA